MTLLRIFSPASPPQVSYSCGVGVVNEFIKCYTIIRGESGINLRADILGASDESNVLQDNCPKKDHLVGIPFLSSYTVEICCKG